jgi:hypothetical protein
LIHSSKGVTYVKIKRFVALTKIKEILQKHLIHSQISENLSPNYKIKDKREIGEVRERGKRKKMSEKEGYEN